MKKQQVINWFTFLILNVLLTPIFSQPFIVTSTADNGLGTLRQAIINANTNPGTDLIQFNIAGLGPHTIFLLNPLPALNDATGGTTIDGYSQPLAVANTQPQGSPSSAILNIIVNGNTNDAFIIKSNNNVIKGIVIQNCSRGITIDGSTGQANLNRILGCYIGTDQTGMAASSNQTGIEINNSAGDFNFGNQIGDGTPGGRNLISGNVGNGILIRNYGSDGNAVLANYIGTDVNGAFPLANARSGVVIEDSASFNIIGIHITLSTVGERNVISGNNLYGIEIKDPGTKSNVVIGNFIGTDALGSLAIANKRTGVRLVNHTKSNTIGSDLNNAYGNLISGNGTASPLWDGIAFTDTGTTNNIVQANFIGTDFSGTTAIPNAYNGVSIFAGAHHNQIGGIHQNVISGNLNDGIWIDGTGGTHNNYVGNNLIGLDMTGLSALPNGNFGILINNGAFANQIGPGFTNPNYISGNTLDGIHISGPNTMNNIVQYCRIGLDIASNSIGNGGNGIHLRNSANMTQIGGAGPFQQIIISSNTGHGIFIDNAQNNLVVGPGLGSVTGQNIITANGLNGIAVVNAGSLGNTFSQNAIFGNAGLDIDLNNDGITLNDPGDPDMGPNDLVNFPVITNATYVAPAPTWPGNSISGTIDIPSPQLATIEIYSVGTSPHLLGNGGGDIFLASTIPDAAGNWSVTLISSPIQPVANIGEFVTALTIDGTGNTSEFSKPVGIFTDINLDQNALVQNEISMAIVQNTSPVMPPIALLAAYNDDPYPQPPGGPGIGVSNSLDGGVTWNANQLIIPIDPYAPPATQYVRVFDPSATADLYGDFYVVHIADDNDWTNGPSSGLFVHKSTDLGITWNTPVTIAVDPPPTAPTDPNYRFNDRCQVAADIDPKSPFVGNLYVTWIKDRGWNMALPLSDIYFSASTDGGVTWTTPLILNALGNMGNMPTITVASNGKIYVCWVDYNVLTGGTATIYLNASTDGGLTWLPTEYPVSTFSLPPINVNDGFGTADALAKGAAVIEVAPNLPQQIYIVYASLATLGDEADIQFIRSTAGGTPGSWSLPLRLNNDLLPPAAAPDQILPWIEVKPNGIIDVAWYDRRNDPADQNWDVYLTTSIDGGLTFPANVKVNTIPASSTPTTPGGRWMGEYLGLVSDFNQVYVGYTSSFSDNNGDVYFNSVYNPQLPMDYGDAFDPPYPTLLQSDGARHVVKGLLAPWLGPGSDNPDVEPDGQPDPLATGDDIHIFLPDDEDGVSIPILYPGIASTITFEVFNGPAYVDGWIDFNNNGKWGDIPSEYVVAGNYATGIHNINITTPVIPSLLPPYGTVSRFRVNTFSPLLSTGFAFDGEVEDNIVQIDQVKWIGSVDSLWSNPANWNCGVVPDSTIDVVISASATKFPIIKVNASCKNLLIEDGIILFLDVSSSLTVHNDMVIGQGTSGKFVMKGGITLVKGKTTLNAGAEIDIQAGTFNSG